MSATAFSPDIPKLSRRTVRESAHLLLDLPVGVVGFSVVVAGIATGASLAITLVGVPLLAAVLLLARYAATPERARARALLDVTLAAPPAPSADGTSVMARLFAPFRDRAAWRSSGYFLLMLPAGTLTFSAVVAWWGSALVLLTLPTWAWALPHGGPQVGDTIWSTPWDLAASATVGVLMVAAAPFVVHALTRIDRTLLRLLDARS